MRVRVDYPPKFGRRLCEKILCICSQIPPKLSNIIISSSTPSECKRSSTVLDIIGGPRRKWLARRNSHASLACRTSSSPQKLKIFGGPAYYGTSAAHLP